MFYNIFMSNDQYITSLTERFLELNKKFNDNKYLLNLQNRSSYEQNGKNCAYLFMKYCGRETEQYYEKIISYLEDAIVNQEEVLDSDKKLINLDPRE